jgi:hypothetical protein
METMAPITDENLRIALEQLDADSWEELARAVPTELAATLKLRLHREGSVVVSHFLASDAPIGNRAIALGLREPCTRGQILALAQRFIATGMKNFALQVSPYARPAALEDWLREAGLVRRGMSVKLVRDAAPVPLPAHDVRLVDVRDKEVFGEVSARGFGRPPIIAPFMASTVGFANWRHFLAYVDGQPAGAAAMYIDGPYAWLGIGSTLPQFRRCGVQQALIVQRIAAGLDLGVKHFVAETESVNTSCGNLVRAGFQIAYERAHYGLPLATAPVAS